MGALIFASTKIILQTSAADWAAATGGDATLFCDNADISRMKEYLGGAFKHVEFFQNFTSSDLVELRAVELHAESPFSNVVHLAECDVMRAARLRARFGLPGMSLEAANAFRNKHEMKRLARAAGVLVPNFAMIDNTLDLLDFVAENGYPVVVKPVDGRGSAGVQVLADRSELTTYVASGAIGRGDSPLAEAFVPNTMYQVNGMYSNGECVLVTVLENINSNLEFLAGKFLGMKMLDDSNPLKQRLIDFGLNVLDNALPMPDHGLFHMEVFHTPDDRILLCEVACRLVGCIGNDQVNAAFGVDLRLEYLKQECLPGYQSPLNKDKRPSGRLIGELDIPPTPGTLKKIPQTTPFPWVEFYKVNGVVGKRYGNMEFTNGEVGSFLMRADSEVELEARFHEVAEWFAASCEWEAQAA